MCLFIAQSCAHVNLVIALVPGATEGTSMNDPAVHIFCSTREVHTRGYICMRGTYVRLLLKDLR
jgi:hypothetical protein